MPASQFSLLLESVQLSIPGGSIGLYFGFV